jgi:DNA-binding NarL/FixJ family response regulator
MDMLVRSLKVFVVEDSVPVRTRLVSLLNACDGIEVIGEAASVTEAVDGIRAKQPAVVVLDIHLIGGTGIDVLRRVKPEQPELHVVVLSNYVNDQYRRACLAAGAEEVLDKHSEFERLTSVVKTWAPAMY